MVCLLAAAWVTSAAVGASVPRSSTTPVGTAASAGQRSSGGAATAAAASASQGAKAATSVKTKTKAKSKPKPKPKPKPLPPLSAWQGLSSFFPDRSVVIAAPPQGVSLSAAKLHITENGAPVSAVTLTPLSAAQASDFGEVIAVAQTTSMNGSGLSAAVNAVQSLTRTRPAGSELGLVTFNSVSTQSWPVNGDASAIASDLSTNPFSSTGDDTAAGTGAALSDLAHSGVATGAIIVISDGAGTLSSAAASHQAAAAATAAHIPVITIGLQDASSTPSGMHALVSHAPGVYLSATPQTLVTTLEGLQSKLAKGYVARYRSAVAVGRPVSVAVTADGMRGTISYGYQATPSPAPSHGATRPSPRIDFAKAFADHGQLSPTAPVSSVPAAAAAAPATSLPAVTAGVAAPAGFWSSTSAVPVVAILIALLLGTAVALLLHRPHSRAVRLRVGSFVPAEPAEPELSLVPDAPTVSGPLAMFARSTWWPPFVEAVEVSRGKYTPNQIVKRSGIAALVVGLLSSVAIGSPVVFIGVLIAWPFVVRKLVFRAAEKQRNKFADGLPAYLQDLASSIRVGRSFVSALGVVGEAADEPTRSEFERAVTDEALGRPLEESLEGVSHRMRSRDMDQVALIAALNRRSGSNVAEALDRVADGARDRADLRREIRALTAQAKLSSLVLTALPGVLLVGLSLISPKYAHPLFHTTIGVVVLSFGAALCFCGWKVMKKITNVEA